MANLPQLSDSVESLVNEEAHPVPEIQINCRCPRARVQSWCGSRSGPKNMKTSNILLAGDKCLPPASCRAALTSNETPYMPLVSEYPSHTTDELRLLEKSIATTRGGPKPPPHIPRRTQVVRGFWPSHQYQHETVPAADIVFEPKPLSTVITTRPREPAKFVLGGSPSPCEHEIGLGNGDSVSLTTRATSPHMHDALRRSEALTNVMPRSGPSSRMNIRDEHTSPIVDARVGTTEDEAVAYSDTDDCIDEHAIDDDDDCSVWENIPKKNDESLGDDDASQGSHLTLLLKRRGLGRRCGSHALRSSPDAPRPSTTHNASQHTLSEKRDEGRSKTKHIQVESSAMVAVYERRGSSDTGVTQKPYSAELCMKANEDQLFVKYCVNDYHTRGW
ncbi:hypothetical protein FSARC_582 [Fusarium sarcochroum]|uniref:DUF3295 domain-containing protein n=1 Tax=Fusarium sarcochroum TaxID=1208366 RepID=A0A8H4UAU0_9HYPO|nr:hypothetical protein FSARC_582 [Fusarium sarcochroum]